VTTVEVSSATFSCCVFADDVTFTAATGGCRFDGSNILSVGKTVTDSGTQNMIINGANDGFQEITGRFVAHPNNVPVLFRKADDSAGSGTSGQFLMDSSDNLNIQNYVTGNYINIDQTGTGFIQMAVNGAASARVDASTTATHTRFLIYDVDNATLERVTVGAADSGGVGFKVLRIPN